MDVGSVENAGAIFYHSIHGDALESFQTILRIHSIHGDTPELFQTIPGIHSIHGDTPELFQTIPGIHSIHGDTLELFQTIPGIHSIHGDKMKSGACRIIGGKWRGRKIKFDDAEGLRPTTDRIRETVFNWLQPYVRQSFCLDCFAGSGVLGFEALSRGAQQVIFIEQNVQTVKKIKQNITALKAEQASIIRQDALSWLQSAQRNNEFDLVFLDPPFHSNLLTKSCSLLVSSGCLAEDAIIYVEHAVDEDVTLPDSWFCLKEKSTGQVTYKLLENRIFNQRG